MMNEDDVRDQFTYHPPTQDQVESHLAIRRAGMELALTILRNTRQSADQTAAIRQVREAVMTANAAVSLE